MKGGAVRENRSVGLWGGVCAIFAGAGWFVPVFFYFYLLPAAGSGPTHAQHPVEFLPWMMEHGSLRVALWWTTAVPLLIALLGVPLAVRGRLKSVGGYSADAAALAGILGFLVLLIAALMLAVGEMPFAAAYADAGEGARPAIIAAYEWQRLATAILFDVLGIFLMGIWILLCSAAGLRCGGLPRCGSVFGLATSALCFLFVAGYLTDVGWLGEGGVGMASFLAIPAWILWMGITLVRGPVDGME